MAAQKVAKLKSELTYAAFQQKLSTDLTRQSAGPEEDAQKWTAKVAADKAAIKDAAQAELLRAQLSYESQRPRQHGSPSQPGQSSTRPAYYLYNTIMVAPGKMRTGKTKSRIGEDFTKTGGCGWP